MFSTSTEVVGHTGMGSSQSLTSLLSLAMGIGIKPQNNGILRHIPRSPASPAPSGPQERGAKPLRHQIHPTLPSVPGLVSHSYLFLLILILHIQDPRVLLRHGAGVLHLQLGAGAEFLLGFLPPANPGLLGHDVVQVPLLLCLGKSRFYLGFNLVLGHEARPATKGETRRRPGAPRGIPTRRLSPHPRYPKIHLQSGPGIMQQSKHAPDSFRITAARPPCCHADPFTAQLRQHSPAGHVVTVTGCTQGSPEPLGSFLFSSRGSTKHSTSGPQRSLKAFLWEPRRV